MKFRFFYFQRRIILRLFYIYLLIPHITYMKKILFFLTFTPVFCGFGQVGIGTTNPNENAALEILSSSQGLLLPRLALSGTASPSPLLTHVSGMLIYNTATAGTGQTEVIPGLYVNDGSKWIRLADQLLLLGMDDTKDEWVNGNDMILLGKLSDGIRDRPLKTEFVVLDNGNVGIATSEPIALLDIGNDQRRTGLNVQGIKIDVAAGNRASISYNNPFTINTTGANDPLTISSDKGMVFVNAKATHPGGLYLQTSSVTRLAINSNSIGNGYDGISIFDDSNEETIKFTKDGKVGIRISNPTNTLHIKADNPLRLEDLQEGSSANRILTADSLGVLTTASNTGAVVAPVGSTEERPTTPQFGMIRYNTTIGRGEMYVEDANGDGVLDDPGWRPL